MHSRKNGPAKPVQSAQVVSGASGSARREADRPVLTASAKTVAIFVDGGFLAHVTRGFEVGRALVRCFGHRVVFCGSGPYMHIPLEAGFQVRPVYTVDREMT